jgi:hypothetical protein
MTFSHLPSLLASFFAALAWWLHRRSAARLPLILGGILFASGRRTVTSWFRAAGIGDDFRPAYNTVCAVGPHTSAMALTVLLTLRRHLPRTGLTVAIDDTPTPRYGPEVEGAGVHHNPTPGPAGEAHVYGHVWVTLALLARHPAWGTIALPLHAHLYIRRDDLDHLPPERRRPFQTKLELAGAQLARLASWVGPDDGERRVVVDGGYAKRPFLQAAREHHFTVFSRLCKDAALRSVPEAVPAGQQCGPGRPRTYGPARISLAKRAGQARGWQEVVCVQYGQQRTKTIKTFLATWRPAGGLIRVVLVKEEAGWLPYFCTDPGATAATILELMADRGSLEQTNKDVKEVWGAGQQQVRNLYSNEACFNLNLWLYSVVETWAWEQPDEVLIDRSASPWDHEPRRPSHADKRKALQREVLREEIREALAGRPTREKIRALGKRLLELAA